MKMIKAIAATALVALPLQFAQAQDATLNAQLAIPTVTGFSGGMALAVGYEMPRPDMNPNLSFEGEFTTSISSPDDTYSDPFGTIKMELSYFTMGAYAKYTAEIDPKIDVYGRIGFLYESVDVKASGTGFYSGTSGTGSSTDTGLSYGFGANYKLNQQMDLTAGYTIVESDIKHLSAGIKYKL